MKGVLCAALVAAAAASAAPTPRVTLVGDSVASAVGYVPAARALLSQRLHVDFELSACRRLEHASCTVAGVTPPTLLELVHERGATLGPVVVVTVGYNDNDIGFTGEVDDVLAAMKQAQVQRVVWLTYRAARHDLLHMNAELLAIAQRHPELTVLDWNRHSRTHPAWFADDHVHLTAAGARALASFLAVQLGQLLR
jgi:hypothetical protein